VASRWEIALIALAKSDNLIDFPVPQQQGKSNEWYTPARYIEAARTVMGGIDLDPASCELANRTVKASRFYSERENGLSQSWYGRIWMNPPYSAPTSQRGLHKPKQEGATIHFVRKLLYSYEYKEIQQAIACLNADMCRKWFQVLWDFPICFSDKPINFHRPGQKSEHHFFSTAFIYLGPHEQRFIDIFSQFGTVARRVSTPKVKPVNLSLWEGI
jgi:hypothetical protein